MSKPNPEPWETRRQKALFKFDQLILATLTSVAAEFDISEEAILQPFILKWAGSYVSAAPDRGQTYDMALHEIVHLAKLQGAGTAVQTGANQNPRSEPNPENDGAKSGKPVQK